MFNCFNSLPNVQGGEEVHVYVYKSDIIVDRPDLTISYQLLSIQCSFNYVKIDKIGIVDIIDREMNYEGSTYIVNRSKLSQLHSLHVYYSINYANYWRPF